MIDRSKMFKDAWKYAKAFYSLGGKTGSLRSWFARGLRAVWTDIKAAAARAARLAAAKAAVSVAPVTKPAPSPAVRPFHIPRFGRAAAPSVRYCRVVIRP